MKKLLFVLFLLMPCLADAQLRITELTADATPTTDDLLVTVNDPSGTPASRKATIGNVVREPNLPSAITRDTEWDTIGEIETATSVNIILNTEIDTFSELDALVADQTLVHSGSNIATSTALAANGSNCSAGSAPLGVDASGASESCTDFEEDLSNSAGLASAISDETGTGVVVFGTSPTIILKQGTAPTPTAEGAIEWDTDDNRIIIGDGASQQTFYSGAHTTDTNANTICTGTTTYLDGEGNCDDISSVYEAIDTNIIKSAEIDTYSELNAIVADVTLTHNGLIDTSSEIAGIIGDETGSGALVLGTSPTISTPALTLVNSATPSTTTEAVIQWDSDDDYIVVGDGASAITFVSVNTKTDGQYCTWDDTNKEIDCNTTPAGSGDVTAVGDCATGDCFTGASGTTLSSNTDLIFDLDEDNNGTESFQILDGLDAKVAEVTEDGTVYSLVGFDGIGAVDMDYGSGDITDHTFITDGTGDAEIVLPADSIGDDEIDWSGLTTSADFTVTGTLLTTVGVDAVGAVDMDYGSADVTDHTFVTDGTGDAEIVLPNDSIGDDELDNSTPADVMKAQIHFDIDGAGSAITTGAKAFVRIPYNMTIQSWDISADQSGSIVIDVWKDTYANFPPTVADTISGTEKPTLSSAQKNQDTSLSSWTTSVTAGDYIRINVDSASTVTKISLDIYGIKN